MIDGGVALVLQALLDVDGPVSSAAIAKQIGLSVSSVKNYIGSARDIIEEAGGMLIGSPGIGFQLDGPKEFFHQLNYILDNEVDSSYSFTHRKKYILSILFSAEPNYIIQLLADDLHVGRNRILKDFDMIDAWLKPFHIQVQRKRKRGVSLSGLESDIREAMSWHYSSIPLNMSAKPLPQDRPSALDMRFSIRYYYAQLEAYPNQDFFALQEILREAERWLNVTYTKTSFRQIFQYLAIVRIRASRGQFVQENEFCYPDMTGSIQFSAARWILEKLGINLQGHDFAEAQRLCSILLAMETQNGFSAYIDPSADYSSVTKTFLETICRILKTRIRLYDELYVAVEQYFQRLLFRKKYHISYPFNMGKEVKEHNSDEFGACFTAVSQIEHELGFSVTSAEIAELTTIVHSKLYMPGCRINAVLVTDSEPWISAYLVQRIQEGVPGILIEKEMTVQEWYAQGKPKGELLLSDVALDDPDLLNIHVDRIEDVISLIKDAIFQDSALESAESASIASILNPKLITTQNSLKDRDSVIRFGCELLMNNGYVTPQFIYGTLKREEISPTSIGHGIAIPHGFREHIKKSGVAVIQLKKDILWTDDDKVDLVFVIAFKNEDTNLPREFTSRLYRMFNDEHMLSKLRQATSAEEMYGELMLFADKKCFEVIDRERYKN